MECMEEEVNIFVKILYTALIFFKEGCFKSVKYFFSKYLCLQRMLEILKIEISTERDDVDKIWQ